jgi:hypothetical protein
MDESEHHFDLAVQLSRDALRALLLVNGGAATALIALMDKSSGSKDYTCAVLLFAAGAVCAVICTCFGYFSQLNYANHRLDGQAETYKQHRRWQTATIAVVFVTLSFMIAGIVVAAAAARP